MKQSGWCYRLRGLIIVRVIKAAASEKRRRDEGRCDGEIKRVRCMRLFVEGGYGDLCICKWLLRGRW